MFSRKLSIAALSLSFLLISGTAFATLTFNTNTITSDAGIDLTPTGTPVTINGDLTVAGICTGCGTTDAPTNATYWVGSANGTLSAENNLGALSTGLVINISGTPSAYTGTSCTNQFVRSLNASGSATCATVSLTADVSGDLPFSNLAQASAASKLLGRGDSGAGDYQEITIGSGLTMTGTTLSASGSGAPTDATYITQTANGTLSNEQALGSLATGLVKNTTTTGVLSIATGGTDYVTPGSITGASVATDETTASTSFVDLATSGPSVTLTTAGTTAIVWLNVGCLFAASLQTAHITVVVSGASTVAASDTNASYITTSTNNSCFTGSRVVVLTGLTPGSNTFKMQYKSEGGGTIHFLNRSIAVYAP